MASKSWVGHGEPAAGIAGLFLATAGLRNEKMVEQLHLRSLNPYVETNISSQSVLLPREKSPQFVGAGGLFMGISAFAFQGTNAHAILKSEFVGGHI